jgi:hypothetical protein
MLPRMSEWINLFPVYFNGFHLLSHKEKDESKKLDSDRSTCLSTLDSSTVKEYSSCPRNIRHTFFSLVSITVSCDRDTIIVG